MNNFNEAQQYFSEHWKWNLHEETFEHLNQEMWVCKATFKQGTYELSFYLLYDTDKGLFFQVPEDAMQSLFRWAHPEMERRMSLDEEGYVKDLGRHRMEHDEQMQRLKDTLTNAETGLMIARDLLPVHTDARANVVAFLAEVEQTLKEMEE